VLIHCAWPEVSNVHSNKHIDEYYKKNLEFIEKIINFGVKKIIVIGSCYEYGLQYGPMFVSTETRPNTPYAKSKDKLHKSLRIMADQLNSFELIWARLFYIYGPGQGKKSIFSQLTEAINSKEEYFKMSYGEQLLDYLPVEIVAEKIVELIDENPGTYNICSGEPISLRRFIENRIKTLNSDIKLVLGYYPYRKDDSNAIWGGDPY
jgi:dTDP-6-deoxy-L-talose 4-dehydrogenase (NAD+)